MENCNGLLPPTKVEATFGVDAIGYEDNKDFPDSYDSVIGMMLYLASNTRTDISIDVHQCVQFTHNNKTLHKTAVKRILLYLQIIKDNGIVFNPSKKMVVDCYADADFAGLWGQENPLDPIFARIRTGFVVNFDYFPLL